MSVSSIDLAQSFGYGLSTVIRSGCNSVRETSLEWKFAAAAAPSGLAAPLVDAPLAVGALGLRAPIAAQEEEDCDKGGDIDRPRHPPPEEEEAVKEKERHAKCGKERSW